MDEHKLQEECQRLVGNEVRCCLSSLVYTLARGYGGIVRTRANEGHELESLTEQAMELASPVDDYEEAATQEGWAFVAYEQPAAGEGGYWRRPCLDHESNDPEESELLGVPTLTMDNAQLACEHDGLEPYQWEIYEHWAVSDWLADKLLAHGEKVDKDFAALCVWGRPTTGQAIAMDAVIRKIVEELHT